MHDFGNNTKPSCNLIAKTRKRNLLMWTMRLWGCDSGVRFALTFLSKQIAECYTSCRRRRVRGLLQGCSKRLFPGWENIWWKICVFLPARGKQNETSSPDFTQPGAHRLEIPCRGQTHQRCTHLATCVTGWCYSACRASVTGPVLLLRGGRSISVNKASKRESKSDLSHLLWIVTVIVSLTQH